MVNLLKKIFLINLSQLNQGININILLFLLI